MKHFGPRPLLYLVIDVAEPEHAKRKSEFLNSVITGLRKRAVPADECRIVLVAFAEETLVQDASEPQKLYWVSAANLKLGSGRSFARVFEKVRELIERDQAEAGGESTEAVVVFVTDGSDQSNWHPVFESFNRATRPTMVTVAHGHAEAGLSGYLEGGAGLGPKVSRRADVADIVVDTVIEWVRRPQTYGRRSDQRASEFVEPGFRYTDAGADPAAGTSRRHGITRVPVYGSGLDPSTQMMGRQAAIAVSSGPRMQTENVDPVAVSVPGAEPVRAVSEVPPEYAALGEPVTDATPTTQLPLTSPPPETPSTGADACHNAAPAEWKGGLEPYEVGDPGNAFKIRSLPDNSEWNQRDTVLDGVTLVDAEDRALAEVRAASIRGLSHRHSGTVRQDDYAFRHTEDGRYLVCAVSDGVSSARLSHKAATIVTRQGCEILTNQLRDKAPGEIEWATVVNAIGAVIIDFGRRLLQKALGPVDAGGLTDEEVARQMAATAVFAIVDLRGSGDGLPVHVCAVGDSSAWILDRDEWRILTKRKNDDDTAIATSRTPALPQRVDGILSPDEVRLGLDEVLVLMSDGVGDPLGDGTNPVGRFLADKWSKPPMPLDFAAQVDFARRSHDDDRTALAVWPVRSR